MTGFPTCHLWRVAAVSDRAGAERFHRCGRLCRVVLSVGKRKGLASRAKNFRTLEQIHKVG